MNQIQKTSVLQPAVDLLKIFNKEWEVIKAKYQFTSNLVEGFCKGFLIILSPNHAFQKENSHSQHFKDHWVYIVDFFSIKQIININEKATGAFGGITRALFAF